MTRVRRTYSVPDELNLYVTLYILSKVGSKYKKKISTNFYIDIVTWFEVTAVDIPL